MSNDEKLQEYFDFTLEDLEENHQSRISEDQLLLVKDKLQSQLNGVALIAGVVGIVIFGGRFATTGDFQSSFITPAILFACVLLYVSFRYAKKSDYSLKMVEGKVNFVWVEETIRDSGHNTHRTSRKLKMRVHSISFDVRQELMDIIDQGDNIRFYYTGGGDIVAAEFLSKS